MNATASLEGPTVCPDSDLLARVAEWPEFVSWKELTQPVLARLAREQGMDLATALLYVLLCRSPEHGPFIRRLDAIPSPSPAELPDPGFRILIAPGAFYRASPRCPGNGWLIRQEAARFGYPAGLIPVPPFAAPAECGRVICENLLPQQDQPIILVSLSKGGLDVAAALARPEARDAFAPVRAWVSMSGILCGTPLVGWLRQRPLRSLFLRCLFRLRGHSFAALPDLDRAPTGPAACLLQVPAHMRVFHVVGFPLRRHLSSPLMRRGYRRLSPLGPNDGVALLADTCGLPGRVYPVWGADHYLRQAGESLASLFARLLGYLTTESSPRGARP
jgi:hypothetical protein